MPFIFILPGIMCLVLVKQGYMQPLTNPDHAYISMVGLLPKGMIGLALATLIVSVVNDVATGIGAFSTVFAIDFYGKKVDAQASPDQLAKVGKRVSWIAGAISVLIALFFSSSDKGLFELGQSLCTYLAPPISTVFILGLLWKRATPLAAELTLYVGTLLCLSVGFCQLINYPSKETWPHFMLLCFYMMAVLVAFMVVVSLLSGPRETALAEKGQPDDQEFNRMAVQDAFSRPVIVLWGIIAVIMFIIYYIFR
jgi:SSS family solute:Na+ symporter